MNEKEMKKPMGKNKRERVKYEMIKFLKEDQ